MPFWFPKWSQVGPKKFKKLKREGSKTDIILKAAQEAAQDGLGEVLGPSWEGLGVAWKGSGAAPGGILGAKISANSESAIRSNKKQRREARAAESHCEVENKLSGIRATRIWSIDR